MSDDKINRLKTNLKILEGQYESVVSEKFNAKMKLSAIEKQCEDLQCEMQQLKEKNGELEKQIKLLKVELDAINKEKKSISAKFTLLKGKEKLNILEGQYESVVSEKFNAKMKFSAVEKQCEDFRCEMQQLKEKNGEQEKQINVLKGEIDAINREKKSISEKFTLLKSKEKMYDQVVGALKTEFEQQVTEYLNKDASGKDDLSDHDQPNNVDVSANESTSNNNLAEDVQVPSSVTTTIDDSGANAVAGVTINGAEQIKVEESEEPHLMEMITGRKRRYTMASIVQNSTQVSNNGHVQMRKTSGTIIKRATVIEIIKTKTVKPEKVEPKKCPIAGKTLNSKEILQRPKRHSTCIFCSNRYLSTPTKAFCGCRNIGK